MRTHNACYSLGILQLGSQVHSYFSSALYSFSSYISIQWELTGALHVRQEVHLHSFVCGYLFQRRFLKRLSLPCWHRDTAAGMSSKSEFTLESQFYSSNLCGYLCAGSTQSWFRPLCSSLGTVKYWRSDLVLLFSTLAILNFRINFAAFAKKPAEYFLLRSCCLYFKWGIIAISIITILIINWTHTCHPSYLGGWGRRVVWAQEVRPAWAA
jgi:hypothetical protein